jgi:hypothetical protein
MTASAWKLPDIAKARAGLLKLVHVSALDFSKPSLVRCMIDSEKAEKLLELNKGNRLLRRTLVEYLKHQITTGEWREDHPQPVVFSNAGRLIDGQHRLKAIAESGISEDSPVIIRVETFADDSVREYMDTGAPRTLDDRVSFVDNLAENKIIAQLATFDVVVSSRAYQKPSPDDAREFFEQHKDACLFIARTKKREKGTGVIAVAYAAMEFHERYRPHAEIFYPALFTVDSDVQQARVLRDYLLRTMTTSARMQNTGAVRNELYHKAIGCMKAYAQNRQVSIVRASSW